MNTPIKVLTRPVVQGTLQDRDRHGAQWTFILLDALGAVEEDWP
ncbi:MULTISPECIES: DUF4387 domain-containing protein [Pseudomonas]|nr:MULTISPECIES: DUF4387 domain-containing protein [Pseudomonas]TCV66055.1 hypothetical protein EDB98_10761 [Pseudomonas fluorescens]SFW21416.1 hypothetical protein SAMN03159439_00532 [Pseudomonas sp. NFACC04-2]